MGGGVDDREEKDVGHVWKRGCSRHGHIKVASTAGRNTPFAKEIKLPGWRQGLICRRRGGGGGSQRVHNGIQR
eukprot:11544416-Alexandrium_andersonii.AAC.1